MGNYVKETAGFQNVGLPSYVERCFCAVVGAGGGGGSQRGGDSTSAASGGGGGGYISGSINILSGVRGQIPILVGIGGSGGDGTLQGNNPGTAGGESRAGPSNSRIIGFGGGGGANTPGALGGGTASIGSVNTITSSNGENTVDITGDNNARAGRGGGAGRPGGNCGGPVLTANPGGNQGIAGCFEHGGSSGDGVNIVDGSDRNNGIPAVCDELNGKNGVISGAGGGGASQSRNIGGNGGPGAVFVSWISFFINDINVDNGGPDDPISVYSGQSFNLKWNSPYGNQDLGTQTFTNTTTLATTESISITDSQNNVSVIYFNVQPAVRITSFTANPNPQTSGFDGVPNFDTELSWNVNSALFPVTYTITSGAFSTSGSTGTSGGVTVTNLPQSVAGVTSPDTRSYTLTVADQFSTDTETLSVSVTNDNTPDNFTIPNQNNVEPSTVTTIEVGPITGIDMVTSVTGSPGVSVSNNNINYSSSTTIQNNGIFYVRVTSLPFNTDPNGLTNSATYSVTVGTVQRFFTLTTRAPDVEETFNFADQDDYVPFPDIDTIPDPDSDIRNQSNQYLISETLLVDDVELGTPNGVEIKLDKPDAQIRVKRFGESTFGSWQNVREI